ncbi:MAG: hypothetical protein B6U72_02615 [Candidatus Altiarchaeales archaeon ex4484_2]|nr:MAG: hypothetical protein B6U72_02615 [Candidatus Altiarchaeales archaeon ex4484_2]
MKKRNHRLFIEDILESMNKIRAYTKNMDYNQFHQNNMAVDAVLRNLEVIGEAAKNIPDPIKEKHPNIPWKKMVGLRNIAIHEYFGIDLTIIWEITTKNLPETKPEIEEMLGNLKKKK